MTQTGGITTAADILNAMDKTVSRDPADQHRGAQPGPVHAIRKKMFMFEDLLLLDPQSIQRIMREIEMRDLTLALKKASEPLKKLLLSNISRRAAESVQEEMSSSATSSCATSKPRSSASLTPSANSKPKAKLISMKPAPRK
jgi:flagellar motor switch protein FliG